MDARRPQTFISFCYVVFCSAYSLLHKKLGVPLHTKPPRLSFTEEE